MKTINRAIYLFMFLFPLALILNLLPLSPLPQALAVSIDAEYARLIADAKREGTVVWYTTTAADSNEAMRIGFQKKYPFLKAEVYRNNNPNLLTRITNEARAGRNAWDVVSIAGFETYILKKENFLAKYVSPEFAAIPDKFKDADGYWTSLYLNPLVFGYNTKLVVPQDLPHSYDDLLNPKWKGKMAFDAKDVEWFANMLKIKGEQKGLEFMDKLSRQNLVLLVGHTLQTQLLAAGEFSSGVNNYSFTVQDMKEKGAAVDWLALDPVITYLYAASASAKAPHPNSARLLLNFMLSKEGQSILRDCGRIPARADVLPKSARLVKNITFVPSDNSLATNFTQYQKQFRKFFSKRQE